MKPQELQMANKPELELFLRECYSLDPEGFLLSGNLLDPQECLENEQMRNVVLRDSVSNKIVAYTCIEIITERDELRIVLNISAVKKTSFSYSGGSIIWVSQTLVHPAHRGKGYQANLLDYTDTVLKDLKKGYILSTVKRQNTHCLANIAKFGRVLLPISGRDTLFLTYKESN